MKDFQKDFQIQFRKGIEEFNSGHFFDCHETLEAVWMTFEGAERELIQGLIQISVGYFHLSRNNQVGALKLFKKGLGRIDKYPDKTLSIGISELSQAVQKTVKSLNSQDNLQKSGNIVLTESFDYPVIKFDWG
jgi:predicted metal-dependent hydrolase